MSTEIEYGPIALQVNRLHTFDEEPVSDGAGNYLYTRFFVAATCVLNPQATSYSKNEAGVDPAAAGPGRAAPVTLNSVRHQLCQHRQKLKVTVAGVVVLESPDPLISDAVDAHNGPLARAWNVRWHLGQKTMEMEFAAETYVNDCRRFKSKPSPLLSHTWNMQGLTDQDHFTTRVIQGRAVFHAGRLRALADNQPNQPDHYRGWLLHPVPENFQRVRVDVHQAENPAEYYYTVVDVEKAVALIVKYNVTRIEAYCNVGARITGVEGGIIDVITGLADIFKGFNPGAGIQRIYGVAPSSSFTWSVRVWGNRNAERNQLADVAYAVMVRSLSTLTEASVQAVMGNTKIDVGHDLMGKFVELRGESQAGPFLTLCRVTAGGFLGGLGKAFYPPEYLTDVTASTGANPTFPKDTQTRGTYPGIVLARALQGTCPTLDRPAAPVGFIEGSAP